MNRHDMIERLVADDVETIRIAMEQGDVEYLCDILIDGKGYSNMTLREVIDEYNSRTWEDE